MKRSEQKIADTWDLSDLYASVEEWKSDWEKCLSKVEAISAFQGKTGSADGLHATLTALRDMECHLEKLSSYAMLRFEADASDSGNQELYGKANVLAAKAGQNTSWLESEIMEIDEGELRSWLEEERFSEFKVFLEKLLRFKSHTLSRECEHLLSLNAEAASTASKTFHDLTDVDFAFEEVAGTPLTHASYGVLLRNPDEKIRKEAYEKYYKVFEGHQNALASLYAGSVKTDIFYFRARGYSSSLERALFPDNVPESVYHNLIDTVHQNFPVLHRFYDLMAEVQKKEKLHHFDVYLPLVEGAESRHTYEEAVDLIGKAVAPLGEEYQQTLISGLTTERWVDRYENEGKRSGAFSAGSFSGKPYILTNYKEEMIDSIFTLIHEGGHSMHSYYSKLNNPFMSYSYTIFEAEVASTFNEQLLSSYLLSDCQDPKLKAYLIGRELESLVATLFRQTMFAEYELLVHEEVEKGGVATVDFLRKSYRGLLEAYFGNRMEFEEVSDLEGLRIPHFYRAFYVYKYATGISAAIALSKRVLEGGSKERDQYLSFLKSGGSRYPIDSLKLAGVDMSERASIQSAIDYFSSLLTTFEETLSQKGM